MPGSSTIVCTTIAGSRIRRPTASTFPTPNMAIRKNPDGSVTVGILKEEKPEVKAEKPKRAAKPKEKGEA